MTKLRLPKLNSWVTTLVLASIGLHGLVLALPMPNLTEEKADVPEPPAPEVIQVVTLPKLAKAPDSPKPPLPEPPEPLPEEDPPFLEEPVEDLVLADPEILDELEPELEEFDEGEWEEEPELAPDPADINEDSGDTNPVEPTLDERLASIDSYADYNRDHTGTKGEEYANSQLIAWMSGAADYEVDLAPNHLTIPNLEVPLQECFQGREPNSVAGIGVLISPDGLLDGEPELLGGTGYGVLNEKALEIARNATYPAAGVKRAYSIQIRINYTRCS